MSMLDLRKLRDETKVTVVTIRSMAELTLEEAGGDEELLKETQAALERREVWRWCDIRLEMTWRGLVGRSHRLKQSFESPDQALAVLGEALRDEAWEALVLEVIMLRGELRTVFGE